MPRVYDAVIVGAGPNGLAAGITLAREGLSTLIVEGHATPGGGLRSSELTLPGFVHDVCSAVHPLALVSPFFQSLDLTRLGVRFVSSPVPLAHLLSNGEVVSLYRSVGRTAKALGPDGPAYRDLMAPLVADFDRILPMILGPIRTPGALAPLARFGLAALRSMRGLSRSRFSTPGPGALLGGMAAHAMVPLDHAASAAFALVLAMAGHGVGWPILAGGSRSLAEALVRAYRALGGELALGLPVRRLTQLPRAHAYLFDTSPRALVDIVGDRLPAGYVSRLARFRYGPGVFKVDWALDGPIPWSDATLRGAVTVHLSGDLDEILESERAIRLGQVPERPFLILAQPTVVDPTRAPRGKHIAWAYCHAPSGSRADMLGRIEAHIARFAPGFRERVIARATRDAVEIERYDPNYVGGDINGGLADLRQLFFRPVVSVDPYRTPAPGVFLCSSSTPPGGGVHGLCGYFAAQSALRHVFGRGLGRVA